MPPSIQRLRRVTRLAVVDGSGQPSPPVPDAASSQRQARQWIHQSIEQCPCPATSRFLEMIRDGIDARLRDNGHDVTDAR